LDTTFASYPLSNNNQPSYIQTHSLWTTNWIINAPMSPCHAWPLPPSSHPLTQHTTATSNNRNIIIMDHLFPFDAVQHSQLCPRNSSQRSAITSRCATTPSSHGHAPVSTLISSTPQNWSSSSRPAIASRSSQARSSSLPIWPTCRSELPFYSSGSLKTFSQTRHYDCKRSKRGNCTVNNNDSS
jgi:hypothetical protein